MELNRESDVEAALVAALDPDHVVVVGASNRSSNAGLSFVRALRAARFPGRLSVVNREGERVLRARGFTALSELSDLPTRPDLAIIALPVDRVEQALAEAIAVGVRAVHVFSGGFAERGDPGRADLQARLAKRAADAGVALIGPNCMGVYRPTAGLAFRADQPMRRGQISIVSQSGGVAIAAVHQLAARDVGVSTVVSFGNAAQLGAGRLAEALAVHGEAGALGVYVESANEPDLMDRLERVAKTRPVVLLVGSSTPLGQGAAVRHTGAPGGLWTAPEVAAGVTLVPTLESFVGALDWHAGTASGQRGVATAFVTISGGIGVLAAAELEHAGIHLPPLDDETRDSIESIIPGGLIVARNPVDLGVSYLSRKVIARSLAALTADERVDLILFHLIWDHLVDVDLQAPGYADGFLDLLLAHAERHRNLAVYFPRMLDDPDELAARRRLRRAGITVFETVHECLGALSDGSGAAPVSDRLPAILRSKP